MPHGRPQFLFFLDIFSQILAAHLTWTALYYHRKYRWLLCYVGHALFFARNIFIPDLLGAAGYLPTPHGCVKWISSISYQESLL
jgi:hypothetical protein